MNDPAPSETTADTVEPRSLALAMCSRRIVLGAARVSLVVGTILNLINNGPQLWEQHAVSLWKVLLNYLVPFCVSSYSAARNEIDRRGD